MESDLNARSVTLSGVYQTSGSELFGATNSQARPPECSGFIVQVIMMATRTKT